ncbi:Proteasome subunit alpha type-5 [Hibiscus syriacus]|uniref:Proteasome subunit alpha type-5 n=1 Tax=Hibiscus syriacus TaxID=106335 RepID=A0A6A3BJ53_HIBSY|nr:Proteasome subunit alpha type-5 [Hibiscus syriacus]
MSNGVLCCLFLVSSSTQRTLVEHARVETQNHRFSYGEPMTVESTTQALCDLDLRFGEGDEESMAYLFCIVVAILISLFVLLFALPDKYYTDPSGTFWQCNAKAIGSEGADSSLQEQFSKDLTLQEAKTIDLSILKQVIEEKVTPYNGDIAKGAPTYHLYTPSEVEARLPWQDVATFENNCRIPENEVNRAQNIAFLNTDQLEPDRIATAWCFAAPAELMNPMSFAANPFPATAGSEGTPFAGWLDHVLYQFILKVGTLCGLYPVGISWALECLHIALELKGRSIKEPYTLRLKPLISSTHQCGACTATEEKKKLNRPDRARQDLERNLQNFLLRSLFIQYGKIHDVSFILTKNDGTWVWFIESDPTWLYNGLPDPSQELSNGTSVKTVGVVASRVKGTASGWFHRAAKTILSWQWEDYRLDPLRSKGLFEPTMTGPSSFSFGYAGPELFLNFLLPKRNLILCLGPSSVEKIMEIDERIGCAMSVLISDAGTLIEHARVETQNHRFSYGEPMTVESTTQALCDLDLRFGEGDEESMAYLFCTVVAILISLFVLLFALPDKYYTDPSGTFWQCNAKAIGSEGGDSSLQEQFSKDLNLQEAKTIDLSILKQVIEEKVTPNNGDIAKGAPTYHLYTLQKWKLSSLAYEKCFVINYLPMQHELGEGEVALAGCCNFGKQLSHSRNEVNRAQNIAFLVKLTIGWA